TATGTERFPRQGHTTSIHALAVSANGRLLASGSEDGVVKIWDLAVQRVLHSLHARHNTVSGLAFSSDGRLLAVGGRDGAIVLCDLRRGGEASVLHGIARGSARLQFSPDGQTLAAGGDGGVQLWDVASRTEFGRRLHHAGLVPCV